MISRRVTGGFVCLSCRLTLAGSVGGRFSVSVSREAPRRAYSDDAFTDAFANAINPTKTKEREQTNPDDDATFRRINAKDRSRRPPPRRPNNTQPEIYRSKGGRLRPKEEALSIDILGKPAHAIVMKAIGSTNRKPRVPDTEAESDVDHVNLSDVLSRQVGIPTADEVLQNIHDLQPAHSRSIPQKELDSLKDVLVKGFTKAQLETYMASYKPEIEPPTAISDISAAPWVLEQWPWLPETGAVSKMSDPLLDGYLHKSMSPKEQLAIRLIRECWRVSAQEVENSQGYLDVKLRDVEFTLLLAENGRRLEGISRSLLAPGKQIELIRPEQIVRIVGSKATSEVILREISNVLAKLETRTFDAKLLAPDCLSPRSLEEVSKITNTVVQLDTNTQKVLAHWIPDTAVREGLENTGDAVFRLLLSASSQNTHTHGKMTVLPESDVKGGRFLVDSYNKEKWSWKDRTGQWARWITATPSQTTSQTESELLEKIPAAFGSGIELETALPADQASLSSTGWPEALQRSTRAVFGHVLHRYPPKRPRQLDLTQTSILSPVIPPLSTLAFPNAPQPSTPSASTILMRFLPDPSQDPSLVSAAPPLELRLEASDTDVNGISSLRAIFTGATTTTTHDILLPSSAVDIRLYQSHFHELTGAALTSDPRHSDHPVLAFLDASDLRPSAGRLVTPPRLPGVPVPLLDHAGAGGVVDYLFAGLEMRRAVAADYEGWRLVYTDVEAGQGGGRRAELELEAVPSAPATDAQPDGEGEGPVKVHDAAAYLAVVAKIAAGGEFKWYGENSW